MGMHVVAYFTSDLQIVHVFGPFKTIDEARDFAIKAETKGFFLTMPMYILKLQHPDELGE